MKDSGEGNEGAKGGSQLVVAGGDPSPAFERLEEVFDAVALAVVAAVERARLDALAADRQTREDVFLEQGQAQSIGVVALVGQQRGAGRPPQAAHQIGGHGDVDHVTRAEDQTHRATAPIDHRVDLGGEATTAGAELLCCLSTTWIGAAVVHANVGAVDGVESSTRPLLQATQQSDPQPQPIPPHKVAVGGAPVKTHARQVPPRTPGAQHMEQRGDDRLQLHRRTPTALLLLVEFTRLWKLYAGTASAPHRVACG